MSGPLTEQTKGLATCPGPWKGLGSRVPDQSLSAGPGGRTHCALVSRQYNTRAEVFIVIHILGVSHLLYGGGVGLSRSDPNPPYPRSATADGENL